ncbi:MAG: DUF1501 domain-containing protein [Myxococcota bacterium]|nr:DUF1501 domain-containing protein [Myxococcota bacterium]
MNLSRRHLLGLGAAGLLLPRPVLSAPNAAGRRFLFIHCDGGWDPAFVFVPELLGKIDHEGDVTASEIAGVPFIDSPTRAPVRQFLEKYGAQTAVLNGMEVRSITHERCRRIILTGSGEGSTDDWPSILAAHSSAGLLLPHLVMDGHAFNSLHADQVVRVGDEGQLPALLSGDALNYRAEGVVRPPAESIEDAFLREHVSALAQSANTQAEANFYQRYATVLEANHQLQSAGADLNLDPDKLGCERDLLEDAATIFDCFERDLSRCGMMAYNGWCAEGWDTHQNLPKQGLNFHDLFVYLTGILDDLQERKAPDGSPLADSTTVVVFSEMGRAPLLNTWGGKDHWTFTSCMLIGSGIRGGQAVGALDDQARGAAIDLSSGAAFESGTRLTASNLGATLLALGDVDPGDYTDSAPLTAVMEGA